ncbi:MAG: penicillin-insensitive murein endopeptidase [Myxococcota bacterium]
MARAFSSVRVAALALAGAVALPLPRASPGSPAQASADRGSRDPTRGPGARRLPRRSRSLGLPFEGGRLRRGVRLRPSRHLRLVPAEHGQRAEGDALFGTWELVQLLERAAFRVHQRLPGAKLSVGELSKEGGGRLPGHASHQNGRDADLAFYMLDARGRPYAPYGFAAFDGAGQGLGPNEALSFDDDRNWELVAKLVADGDARVQYLFVHASLERRLLRTGRRRRAPRAVLARAERVMVQPASGHPHRNHFHLRIYCPPASLPACRDRGPRHPWAP